MPSYTYNGVTVTATRRRPSTRTDKKYMRTVTVDGRDYLVHYGDPDMEMQRDIPERRRAFLERHSCGTKKDPLAPGFWACLDWQRTDEKSIDMGTKAHIFALPEGSEYTGVMLALYPAPELAQQIAEMSGVDMPAEQLHVTLAYCGRVENLTDEQVAGAVLATKRTGEMSEPLTGTVNGLGRFNASQSSDGKDVIYAVVDVPGLEQLRNEVLSQLRYAGCEVASTHGYTPHMTLAYIDAGTESPIGAMPTLPLRFDRISVAIGGKRTEYPLSGDFYKSTPVDADNVVLAFGGHVKALGDGRVGGYLVRFGDADDTDLEGDYFTAQTDFDIDWNDSAKSATYYNHGLDPVLKRRKLTTGMLKRDDVGVWVEAQLQMRDEYERAIYKLAEQNKLGWSSGTAPHLVERKAVDGANEIVRWPLGLDASLTPTPAEHRNAVVSLKSWQDHGPQIELSTGATPEPIDVEETEDVEAVQPEDARPASATVTEAVESAAVNQPILQQEVKTIMENEQVNTQAIDMAAVAAQAAQQAVQAVMTQFATVSDAVKTIGERVQVIENQPVNTQPVNMPASEVKNVNTNLKTKPGDSETKAYAYFLRTGDAGAIGKAMKASNDTDMNVGTAADGGYAVPTGHYNGIIARLDEAALYRPLGVQVIPGMGTTVNVPVDNEADGEFVSTAEAAAFDRDAPAINQVAMTLVKYTKKVELSYELLQDEDSRLMAFLDDFVGRGMAKTHNSLLLIEARASGTAALTLDAAAAVGAAEIPELMYKLPAEYDGGAAWIMKRASEGYLRGLTGNNFQFVPTPQGSAGGGSNTLFGKQVYNSEYASAIAASAKSLIYGNFRYMGMRLAPDITVLRDPYSKAGNGQIVLHYYFRTVYKVLQAEAIVYATHPSA